MTLSQNLCYLSSKLLKFLRRKSHFNFDVLSSLNLKNHFWSQNFINSISAQNNINFPLAIGKVQSTMSLLEIMNILLFGIFKIEFSSVLITRADGDIFIWVLVFHDLWSKSLLFVVGRKTNFLIVLSVDQHAFLSKSIKNFWS